MASERRLERLNALIKEVLGNLIFENVDVGPGELITIVDVLTTEDLLQSDILISILPDKNADAVFKKLKASLYDLQHQLNRKLRMRPVPKLVLKLDQTENKAQKIYELLKKADEQN